MKILVNLFALFVIALSFSCKAQTISLEQMEECAKRPNRGTEGCPDLEGAKFVKDIGNRLNVFDGTWKASYNGKKYELKLEKKVDFGENDIKWDKLIGKLKVKNNSDNIIFNSFSYPEYDASPYGNNFQGSSYEMSFLGNSDCHDAGIIFLDLSSTNPNSMTVQFFKDIDEILVNPLITCPNYNTYETLFPNKIKVTFTKQ